MHVDLIAALLVAQRHDGAKVVLRHENGGGDDRLADFLDLRQFRQLGRIFHLQHGAVAQDDFVDDGRRRGDQVLVELALQTLLDDLHVQQAEKAAAEAEAERLRDFRLVMQRGVVELELLQRLAQRVVLVGFDRIQPGEHLRLDLLEARQGRAAWRSARVIVSPTLAACNSLMPEMTKPTSPARKASRATDFGVNTPTCSHRCCAPVAMRWILSFGRSTPSTTRTSMTTPT